MQIVCPAWRVFHFEFYRSIRKIDLGTHDFVMKDPNISNVIRHTPQLRHMSIGLWNQNTYHKTVMYLQDAAVNKVKEWPYKTETEDPLAYDDQMVQETLRHCGVIPGLDDDRLRGSKWLRDLTVEKPDIALTAKASITIAGRRNYQSRSIIVVSHLLSFQTICAVADSALGHSIQREDQGGARSIYSSSTEGAENCT